MGKNNYANADSATKAQAYDARYKRLLDSTKDKTVHYGITGAISYDKAKREELNLGLDLKGGMNVPWKLSSQECFVLWPTIQKILIF